LQVAGLESCGGTLVLRGLSDLGRFPQWTMDVAVAQREGQPGVYVAVGTSDNQVQVFVAPGDAGQARGVLEHCRLLSTSIMQQAVHASSACQQLKSQAVARQLDWCRVQVHTHCKCIDIVYAFQASSSCCFCRVAQCTA